MLQRHRNAIGFGLFALACIGWIGVAGCGNCPADGSGGAGQKKVLVLGFDGMDPVLVREMMDQGRLPNFKRVADSGTFMSLGTAMPPQSPVAWSNFIAGADPGVHEVYDFIHRRVKPRIPALVVEPFLSTSELVESKAWLLSEISLGADWHIPLAGAQTRLLRQGPAFFEELVKSGVHATIYRVPGNYPVSLADGPGCLCAMSGMGTPDLLGGYGEFSFFSSNPQNRARKVAGGQFIPFEIKDDSASVALNGPTDPFRRAKKDTAGNELVPEPMTAEVLISRDPTDPVLKLTVDGNDHLLKQGEWSDWIHVSFHSKIPWAGFWKLMTLPTSVPGVVRIYVKQVRPQVEFYVSTPNIDPLNPITPVSTPSSFVKEVAKATGGAYYTMGIPEDTSAVRRKALTEDEFLQQAYLLLDERIRQYRFALEHFQGGFLFFYFGTPDQLSHIFWRDRDPKHPGRIAEQGDRYADVITDTYVRMDEIAGEALARLNPQDTLIIMSDHGFSSFRRGVNLNTWLVQNNYLSVHDRANMDKYPSLTGVDWERTRVYALGINSLYVNVNGREKKGIVRRGPEYDRLVNDLSQKLLQIRDEDGTAVIEKVYITRDVYPKADFDIAPDLLVGYSANYRGSWDTALGGISKDLLEDNKDRWSGDHCIAAHLVPGILITNRKVQLSDPDLRDVGPTILAEYGVSKPAEMTGRALFGAAPAAQ